MEASSATPERERFGGLPAWALGLIPVALIAAAAVALIAFGAPGLGDRNGVPVEDLVVERTALRPGEIELTVRNDGPDAVSIEQVSVNDAYQPFSGAGEIGRLGSSQITIPYPWVEGEAYEVFLLTATGGTVAAPIEVAAETPGIDLGFLGLMALLGIYVGVIPISIGMIWLPFLRRVGPTAIRTLMAFTIGLLAFLAIDALLEGVEIANGGPQAFGGAALVFLGAAVAYLSLVGVDVWMRKRRSKSAGEGAGGAHLAMLIAVGIGLHNLGEGLAIGSSYAAGALALGTFLVVGFAIHNTTEGLAIVAPLANSRPRWTRLLTLGLIAGGPAVLGAWIGAAAYNPSVVSFLFGAGVGAIIQVIVQLAPQLRGKDSPGIDGAAVAGLLAGIFVMYATGLLVSA